MSPAQTPYCMRNPHPCYLQSFRSKLQGQHVQASPNAQCPLPDAYNEGALGVQSPATPDLEPGPQFSTEASLCYGLPSGKISRPSDNCKQVIDGAQYAQLHHLTTLGKMLLRYPCLDLWFSDTRMSLSMQLWQSGLHMTEMLQPKNEPVLSPP